MPAAGRVDQVPVARSAGDDSVIAVAGAVMRGRALSAPLNVEEAQHDGRQTAVHIPADGKRDRALAVRQAHAIPAGPREAVELGREVERKCRSAGGGRAG